MSKSLITVPLDFEINPQILGEGITQSEMQTFDNCPEKWYLRYNLMLEKKGSFSWALIVGSAIHASLEEFYATKGKRWTWNLEPFIPKGILMEASNVEKMEYWRHIGQVMLEAYTEFYKDDFKIFEYKTSDIENVVDLEFKGFRLKGMIDLLAFNRSANGTYIVDHKTAGRIDKTLLMGWDFRFQFMFYCWLARRQWPDKKIKGWMPNTIKKPELRPKQNESIPAFAQRVKLDMQQFPEKYFYRELCPFTKGSVERFEVEILLPKLERFRILTDAKTPDSIKMGFLRNKNTDHCIAYGSACQFLPLCQHGAEIEKHQYSKRLHKHEELADAEV